MDNFLIPGIFIFLAVTAFCIGFRAYMDGWFKS